MDGQYLLRTVTSFKPENEAILAAKGNMEAVVKRLTAERAKLVAEAYRLGGEEAVQIGRTATTAAEVEPILRLVERMHESFLEYGELPEMMMGGFGMYDNILLDLQTVLRARETGEPQLLGMALQKFLHPGPSRPDAMDLDYLRKRAGELLKPYADAVERAQSNMTTALVAHRPSEELVATLAKLEKAETDLRKGCSSDTNLVEKWKIFGRKLSRPGASRRGDGKSRRRPGSRSWPLPA